MLTDVCVCSVNMTKDVLIVKGTLSPNKGDCLSVMFSYRPCILHATLTVLTFTPSINCYTQLQKQYM